MQLCVSSDVISVIVLYNCACICIYSKSYVLVWCGTTILSVSGSIEDDHAMQCV